MIIKKICIEYCYDKSCICRICERNITCIDICRESEIFNDGSFSFDPFYDRSQCKNFKDWITKMVKLNE